MPITSTTTSAEKPQIVLAPIVKALNDLIKVPTDKNNEGAGRTARDKQRDLAEDPRQVTRPRNRQDEFENYLKFLPDSVSDVLQNNPNAGDIREVILKTGQEFQVLYADGHLQNYNYKENGYMSVKDLNEYTKKQGLVFDDVKLRANINNTLHRVTKFTTPGGNVDSLHVRYGTEFATPLPDAFKKDILSRIHKKQNIVFMGVGGAGKTTTLRQIAKNLTQSGKRVIIVDPEYEICGPNENSSIGVGRAERVVPFTKAEKSYHPFDIKARMTNMSSRAIAGASNASIIFDELLSRDDANAVAGVGPAGANAIASFHGDELTPELIKKFGALFGNPRTVTVSDTTAAASKSQSKDKYEVDVKAVMDTLVVIEKDNFIVYDITKKSLEDLLNNNNLNAAFPSPKIYPRQGKKKLTQGSSGKKYKVKEQGDFTYDPNFQENMSKYLQLFSSKLGRLKHKKKDNSLTKLDSLTLAYYEKLDRAIRELKRLNMMLDPRHKGSEWEGEKLQPNQIQERMKFLYPMLENITIYKDLYTNLEKDSLTKTNLEKDSDEFKAYEIKLEKAGNLMKSLRDSAKLRIENFEAAKSRDSQKGKNLRDSRELITENNDKIFSIEEKFRKSYAEYNEASIDTYLAQVQAQKKEEKKS